VVEGDRDREGEGRTGGGRCEAEGDEGEALGGCDAGCWLQAETGGEHGGAEGERHLWLVC